MAKSRKEARFFGACFAPCVTSHLINVGIFRVILKSEVLISGLLAGLCVRNTFEIGLFVQYGPN